MTYSWIKRIRWKNLLILVTGTFAFVYLLYKAYDAVWVFEEEVFEEMSDDAPLYIRSTVNQRIDSLLPFPFTAKLQEEKLQLNQILPTAYKGCSSFAALYATSEDDYDFIHYVYTGFAIQSPVDEILRKGSLQVRVRNFKGKTIHESIDSNGFSITYSHGFLILSTNPFLLDNYIIKKSKSATLSNNTLFHKAMPSKKLFTLGSVNSSDNAIQCILSGEALATLGTQICASPAVKAWQQWSTNKAWYIFNQIYIDSKKSLVLEGYTATHASWSGNLGTSAPATAMALLPNTVGSYRYIRLNSVKGIPELFARIWDKECVFFNLENRSMQYHDYDACILKVTSATEAQKVLNQYEISSQSQQVVVANKAYICKRLNFATQINDAFANADFKLQSPYYICIGNYIVLLNSMMAVETFIQQFTHGKAMQTNATAPMQGMVSTCAYPEQLTTFCKSKKIATSIQQYKSIYWTIEDTKEGLKIKLECNTQQENKTKLDQNLVWASNLSDTALSYVYAMNSRDAKSITIFAQDKKHTLYGIDADGKLLWDLQLDSKICSEVHSIDYYNTQGEQWVFNTQKYLYVVDKYGNTLENFPIRLGSETNNAMICIFKNKQKHEALYFVPCTNGSVYAYEHNGLPLAGWNPKTCGTMSSHFQYYIKKGLPVFFHATPQNEVLFYDVSGKTIGRISADDATQMDYACIRSDTSVYLFNSGAAITKYYTDEFRLEKKSFSAGEGVYAYTACMPKGQSTPIHVIVKENQLRLLNSSGKELVSVKMQGPCDNYIRTIQNDKGTFFLCRLKDKHSYFVVDERGQVLNTIAIPSESEPTLLINSDKLYMFKTEGVKAQCIRF